MNTFLTTGRGTQRRKLAMYLALAFSILLMVFFLSAVIYSFAHKSADYNHLDRSKSFLSHYERLLGAIDPSVLYGQDLTDVEVTDDLRAIGVVHIASGRGSVSFQLLTSALDSDEMVLYLPNGQDPTDAATRILKTRKIRGVEELTTQWYLVKYD